MTSKQAIKLLSDCLWKPSQGLEVLSVFVWPLVDALLGFSHRKCCCCRVRICENVAIFDIHLLSLEASEASSPRGTLKSFDDTIKIKLYNHLCLWEVARKNNQPFNLERDLGLALLISIWSPGSLIDVTVTGCWLPLLLFSELPLFPRCQIVTISKCHLARQNILVYQIMTTPFLIRHSTEHESLAEIQK